MATWCIVGPLEVVGGRAAHSGSRSRRGAPAVVHVPAQAEPRLGVPHTPARPALVARRAGAAASALAW